MNQFGLKLEIGQVELKWFSNAVNCSTLISTLLCDWLICHFLFLHLDGVTGSCCMKYLPSVSISRSLIWPAGKHSTRAGCCGSGRRELARTLSLIHIGTVPPDSNTTVLMLLTLSLSLAICFFIDRSQSWKRHRIISINRGFQTPMTLRNAKREQSVLNILISTYEFSHIKRETICFTFLVSDNSGYIIKMKTK